MSETKFTPGPWERKPGSLRVQRTDLPSVAICYTDTFGTSGQSDANANLIAAAPDLYQSLKEILSLAREWGKNPEYYTQAESNLIGFAESAIAKAEGRI